MEQDFDADSFVTQAAAALGLPLSAKHRPGVVHNLARISAIALLVMEFPLPEKTEPAPVFRP
ncbi:MAG TPA: DUF4089 domain-containing protein [Stellaceae bacterium]|nr:DUF4089 domain-containing protein [Stellaceae bacterium]